MSAHTAEREQRPATTSPTERLRALDAIRGLAIVIMLLAGNPFPREHLPNPLRHPDWEGLTFADLFFPLFLFAMGVAMTLSRRAGSPRLVLRRVLLLIVFGIALTSLKHERFATFGVLQHIAGSYLLAWLVLRAPRKMQPAIASAILLFMWGAFLVFANGHPWGQQDTFAHDVQGWLIGGFSTEGPVQTITSTVTVLGGAFVGLGMRMRRDPRVLLRWVSSYAVWFIAAGLIVGLVIPINKKLWTPSFTLLTIGSSCAWFALLIWLSDARRRAWLVRPLEDLGANPIAIYLLFMTLTAIFDQFRSSWPELSVLGSKGAGTLVYGFAWTALAAAFAHLLVRRRIYIKL